MKSNDNQTRMCLSTPFGKIRWSVAHSKGLMALFCWHIDLRLKTGGLGWNFPLPWNLSIYTVIVQLSKYHLMSLFLLSNRTAISSCLCSGPAAVFLAKHWYPLWGEPGIDTLHVILQLGLLSSDPDATTPAFKKCQCTPLHSYPCRQAITVPQTEDNTIYKG